MATDHSCPLGGHVLFHLWSVCEGWALRVGGYCPSALPSGLSLSSKTGHPPGQLQLRTVTCSLQGQCVGRTQPRPMAGLTPGAGWWTAAAVWTQVTRRRSSSGGGRTDGPRQAWGQSDLWPGVPAPSCVMGHPQPLCPGVHWALSADQNGCAGGTRTGLQPPPPRVTPRKCLRTQMFPGIESGRQRVEG